jgi:hypothetical protein
LCHQHGIGPHIAPPQQRINVIAGSEGGSDHPLKIGEIPQCEFRPCFGTRIHHGLLTTGYSPRFIHHDLFTMG